MHLCLNENILLEHGDRDLQCGSFTNQIWTFTFCCEHIQVYRRTCFAKPSSSQDATTETGNSPTLRSRQLLNASNKWEVYWIFSRGEESVIVLPEQRTTTVCQRRSFFFSAFKTYIWFLNKEPISNTYTLTQSDIFISNKQHFDSSWNVIEFKYLKNPLQACFKIHRHTERWIIINRSSSF